MEVKEAIRKRRSVRRFKPTPIEKKEILDILELAICAPSAGNLQGWEFVVVSNKHQKERLAAAAWGQRFIADAPWVVVVCANEQRSASTYGERGARLYCLQDSAAAIQNLLLACVDRGYGACWVGAFDEREAATVIASPSGIRPVAIIPIGVPDEHPSMPPRIPLEKVVHMEKF